MYEEWLEEIANQMDMEIEYDRIFGLGDYDEFEEQKRIDRDYMSNMNEYGY